MKNKSIIDSWNKAEPESRAQDRMLENIIAQSGKRKILTNRKPLTTIAAVCALVVAGVFLTNNIDKTGRLFDFISSHENSNLVNRDSDTEGENLTGGIAELSDEIKGLPVQNFKLSDMELNVSMDRIAFVNFLGFFEYDTVSFVIVKVAKTQLLPGTGNSISDLQISTVKVLDTVWGEEIPEAVNLTQYLYGGCTGDEATNLLRKNGVYLLPLGKYDGKYYVNGDLDVLFEIDEEGKIWSHSDYSNFNGYDGEDYQAVTKEILRISQDDALMLAASNFGMALRGWQLLEVTIISDPTEQKAEYGSTITDYSARVESTLSGAEPETEIIVLTNAAEEVPFNNGDRYLLFVDNYNGKHYINSNMLAEVEADGTIKDLGREGSTFAEYNGYTVDRISELAFKVTEFLKTLQ